MPEPLASDEAHAQLYELLVESAEEDRPWTVQDDRSAAQRLSATRDGGHRHEGLRAPPSRKEVSGAPAARGNP